MLPDTRESVVMFLLFLGQERKVLNHLNDGELFALARETAIRLSREVSERYRHIAIELITLANRVFRKYWISDMAGCSGKYEAIA